MANSLLISAFQKQKVNNLISFHHLKKMMLDLKLNFRASSAWSHIVKRHLHLKENLQTLRINKRQSKLIKIKEMHTNLAIQIINFTIKEPSRRQHNK